VDNIVQLTYQYILIIRNLFRRESDAELTDKFEIIAFIPHLGSAGALRNNKQNLEELWVAAGDGTETFRLVINQRHFKILIRCIIE
jgi:hypothetical protein